MGAATLELTSLDVGKTTDITLCLQDPSKPCAQLGDITLTVTLYPKTQEDKEQVNTKSYIIIMFLCAIASTESRRVGGIVNVESLLFQQRSDAVLRYQPTYLL